MAGLLNFSAEKRPPKGAPGYRAYAVGDIHGRLDLLDQLLSRIEADSVERGSRKTLLLFLGDYIDRGPQSAQVIERLYAYHRENIETLFLLGNHEEVLLRVIAGEISLLSSWLRLGGAECLQSYGVSVSEIRHKSEGDALQIIRRAIPQHHLQFLKSCIDTCRFGDYLFVHAGIRPGVPVEQQTQADLRWIREPFLSDETDHGFVVVHGHTISLQVQERRNRVGIDTGAYRTGVLTALGLEGENRWSIDTRMPAHEHVSQH